MYVQLVSYVFIYLSVGIFSRLIECPFQVIYLCLRTLNEFNVGEQVPNGGGHL